MQAAMPRAAPSEKGVSNGDFCGTFCVGVGTRIFVSDGGAGLEPQPGPPAFGAGRAAGNGARSFCDSHSTNQPHEKYGLMGRGKHKS